uniref:Charged multivesicular body protein 6 n=1 Tax=Panagrellus redivivus TaxID=6233 RepID=A0A7E4UQ83_PANRE
MGTLFSKNKHNPQDKITEQDRAILGLKKQRNNMQQAVKKYDATLAKEKEMAKELIKQGRKDRALLLLKRKKYQEGMLAQIHGQMDTVEKMIIDLEAAVMNKEILEQLAKGNDALKSVNATFSIEDAERIMEDTAESIAYSDEISAVLHGKLSEDDIADVEDELNALIAEQLPTAPSEALPEVEKVKEKPVKEKRERVALEA